MDCYSIYQSKVHLSRNTFAGNNNREEIEMEIISTYFQARKKTKMDTTVLKSVNTLVEHDGYFFLFFESNIKMLGS